jgi:hypothetical protein
MRLTERCSKTPRHPSFLGAHQHGRKRTAFRQNKFDRVPRPDLRAAKTKSRTGATPSRPAFGRPREAWGRSSPPKELGEASSCRAHEPVYEPQRKSQTKKEREVRDERSKEAR